jgi:hypothetical protein
MHISAKSGSGSARENPPSKLASRLSRIAIPRSGPLKAIVPAAVAGTAAAVGLMLAPAVAQAQPEAPGSAAQVTAVQAPQASSSCGSSTTLRATHLYQGPTAVALLPQCTGLYVLCYFVSTPAGNDYERDYVNWTSVTQWKYTGNVIDEYVQWYGEEASQVGYPEC